MLYFKTIRLEPSEWDLDVVVTEDLEQYLEFCSKRYGLKDYLKEREEGPWVATFETEKGTELDGEKRILMKLENLKDRGVMVHEMTHVLFHFQEATGVEINTNSQEWIAMFNERIWNELCRPTYEKIKK